MVTTGAMTKRVDSLEQSGFITRRPSPSDRARVQSDRAATRNRPARRHAVALADLDPAYRNESVPSSLKIRHAARPVSVPGPSRP